MKKMEDRDVCHNWHINMQLGEKHFKIWREKENRFSSSTYDYSDSELVVNIFPRLKMTR